MRSDATSVEAYLASLPDDRRQAIAALREAIRANLPEVQIEKANSGTEALSRDLPSYDLVILDQNLPDTMALQKAFAENKDRADLFVEPGRFRRS